MRYVLIVLHALLAGCAALAQPEPAFPPPPLVTVAERTHYRATARHEEVVAFLEALAEHSPLARTDTLGTTTEGRRIPLIILADPPLADARAAERDGRPVVLIIGGIHAGECDGKDALLALARDLALGTAGAGPDPLLKQLIIVIVPLYNPDGNERLGPVDQLRPGQGGPDQVGVRENAMGLDLNRDFVKLEAPETRALVAFINDWDPVLFIDTHTTNGSYHRYPITWDGPKHPAGDDAVVRYAREIFLPAIAEALRTDAGLETFWYGNFAADHTRWETFPDLPRYSTNYVGMRNRLSVLSESYSYASHGERVRAQYAFVRQCLIATAQRREEIRALLEAADRRAAGDDAPPVPLRSEQVAMPGRVRVLGYHEVLHNGRAVPAEPREYEVELLACFEPRHTVARPRAYLIPPAFAGAVETLQRHGIRVEELREDVDLDVTVYAIEDLEHAERPFQGHRLCTLRVKPQPVSRRLPAGTLVVRTAQRLGHLATYLLEPESPDGLAAWNVFDEALSRGGEYPVLRLEESVPLLTAPAPTLPERRHPPRPPTFDDVYESHPAPNFGGSPAIPIAWLADGEHFLQVRQGRLWRVEARSGRVEPATDPQRLAAALRAIPLFDTRAAESIARRTDWRTDARRQLAVFEYADDLYALRLDGSFAARLTSTPQREELFAPSPDGQFVAFVRENDLWVVDVATRTERALTAGGSETVRRGKHSWVYFEELYDRNWQAWWWSPDSRRIAFLETDESPVPAFTIVGETDSRRQRVERTAYPRAGEPNPRVRLLVVSVAGGEPREADLSAWADDDRLVAQVGWWPDGSKIYAWIANRVQTHMDLITVSADGGTPIRLLRQTTPAWVDVPPPLRILPDGSFLLLSEQTGRRHIYRHGSDGRLIAVLTAGEWDVRNIVHVDEPGETVLFTATKESPMATDLYRVPLDGGTPARLTTMPGSHRCLVSPNGRYVVDTWSSMTHPPKVALLDARDGSLIRMLDTNPVRDLERFALGTPVRVQVPMSDGFVLEGTLLYPPAFDPARRYPVWMPVYAGPGAPTVRDAWDGGRAWDQVLASAGLIVFRCDPRSASGNGAASAWACYRQLGVQELADLEAAVRWLSDQPGVDATRVGIGGHSYGGFMAAYALTHSQLFAAGIASAPVTDWREYDTIYTERYMLTPQENPGGYERSSVIAAAANLHGRLLLMHGLMDDNVHFRNTARLVHALQNAGKTFELMVYPEARHGLSGRHAQRVQYDFILRALRPERTDR